MVKVKDIDTKSLIEHCVDIFPSHPFVIGCCEQYSETGWLSVKQVKVLLSIVGVKCDQSDMGNIMGNGTRSYIDHQIDKIKKELCETEPSSTPREQAMAMSISRLVGIVEELYKHVR